VCDRFELFRFTADNPVRVVMNWRNITEADTHSSYTHSLGNSLGLHHHTLLTHTAEMNTRGSITPTTSFHTNHVDQ